MKFKKLNVEPITIQYEPDGEPSFVWNNARYYLDNFIRTHNNPWTDGTVFPDYIHGYEAENYFNPLFIELVGDEAVNLYEEGGEV